VRAPLPQPLPRALVHGLAFSLVRDDGATGAGVDIFLLAEDGQELLTEAGLNILVEL